MEKVDFDHYAEDYDRVLAEDLSMFGEESRYFAEYKIKLVREKLSDKPLNILDFGCGIGRNLKYFNKFFPEANISGCDISAKSIEIAQKNNPDSAFFILNDENIKKHINKFDLIFTSCVFHHIQPALRIDSMNQIDSMLKVKGIFFIFEHNPYNPVTRKIVKDCIWDEDAILLNTKEMLALTEGIGFKLKEMKYTLFFPAFLKLFRFSEKYLGSLPLGGQYYVMAEK
ncbi:MAG TPA: class I SAM-dependent methyltransferase [Ignavibacteria bacterium]